MFATRKVLLLMLAALTIIVVLNGEAAAQNQDEKDKGEILYYTCSMHPEVRTDDPDDKCPICNMVLVPVYKEADESKGTEEEIGEREILYYTCGMHPTVKADEPGSCPICNMSLVPVYKKPASPEPGEGRGIELIISPDAARLAQIKTAEVVRKTLTKTIRAAGEIAYDETRIAVIAARVGGRIERLFADFTGKEFNAGAPLATIYSPELLSAQKEYLLARNSGLASAAKEKLLLWGITEKQIKELENRGETQTSLAIYAPIGGTIVEKHIVEGKYVKEGETLFHMANLSRVWIIADVFENDLGEIHLHQEAAITSEAYPGETSTGHVTFIDPAIDRKTRAAGVRIEVDNVNRKFVPGMFVNVEIKSEIEDVLAVPRSAIVNTGTRSIAFVEVEAGRYVLRQVTIGTMAEGHYVILEGLSEGKRVVTRGSFLLDSQTQLTGEAEEIYGGALGKESKESKVHNHKH